MRNGGNAVEFVSGHQTITARLTCEPLPSTRIHEIPAHKGSLYTNLAIVPDIYIEKYSHHRGYKRDPKNERDAWISGQWQTNPVRLVRNT